MSIPLRLPESTQTIPAALAFWASSTPHSPAMRAIDGHELAFGVLHERTSAIATRLSAMGVRGEDRVAFAVPSGIAMGVALLGTMTSAVAAPLNPNATSSEFTRDLERLGTRLLVVGGPMAATVGTVAAGLGIATIAIDDLTASHGGGDRSVALPSDPDLIAVILHTSGTTGLPKRVPRSHRTYVATARIGRERTALTRHDVALIPHGLHTGSGIANMLAAVVNGGACVLAPGFDPALVPRWLADHRPTWAVATMTELGLVLRHAAATDRACVVGPGSRLRMIRAGGQPMTTAMVESVEHSFAAIVLDEYGMSEASCIAVSGFDARHRREGSCGRVTPDTVRIVAETGQDVSPGMPGEIAVRGPTLFAGYMDDPEANAAAFLPGGWFRTGDLGRLDEDGFLYLTGRKKEQLNRGGDMIAPAEVDRRLLEHPAVAEAATFGIPDESLGEDIVAAIVLKPGATTSPRELRAWMLDVLSAYKVPRRILFVAELPRTESGKARRGELSRMWQERRH